jgi:hypothetical protein
MKEEQDILNEIAYESYYENQRALDIIGEMCNK